MKWLGGTLAFLTEIAMLVAIAYAALELLGRGALGWTVALGGVVAVAALWGVLMAPRSARRLRGLPARALEVGLFGGTALLLWAADAPGLAVAFAVLAVVQGVIAKTWPLDLAGPHGEAPGA